MQDVNTNSEAHRHACEVKEFARFLYLSMYPKLIATRIENGDTFKRRLDGVEKYRGKDAREKLESDAWEFYGVSYENKPDFIRNTR